jgi:hypothetical protein
LMIAFVPGVSTTVTCLPPLVSAYLRTYETRALKRQEAAAI